MEFLHIQLFVDGSESMQEAGMKIVYWYFNHEYSYKSTASEFGCSYSQVRDWVIKFKDKGDDGLLDRRGKRKADEDLSSEERMKPENARLRTIINRLEMENERLNLTV